VSECDSSKKQVNCSRVVLLVAFASLFVVALVLRGLLVIHNAHEQFFVYFKAFWCFASASLGFSVCILRYIREDGSFSDVFLQYFRDYIPNLLWMSLLVYSLLSVYGYSSGFVFYTFSFSICMSVGVYVIQLEEIFASVYLLAEAYVHSKTDVVKSSKSNQSYAKE